MSCLSHDCCKHMAKFLRNRKCLHSAKFWKDAPLGIGELQYSSDFEVMGALFQSKAEVLLHEISFAEKITKLGTKITKCGRQFFFGATFRFFKNSRFNNVGDVIRFLLLFNILLLFIIIIYKY